ncbi:MAG: GHKL domain-containing protein, partial [bacterium]|nr:GHKL domain-containing protein [bacterium]
DRFTNITFPKRTHDNSVHALLEYSRGTILLATARGLKKISGGKISNTGFEFPPVKTTCLLQDSGKNLWVGTEAGLYKISGDQMTLFTVKNGLPHHMIYALLEDAEGNIRVGTGRGLACYKNGSFANRETELGLAANECFSILEDHRQYLWIGTSNGINRFDGKNFKLLTVEKDGISCKSCTPGASFKDAAGNLWFGSLSGLTRINPMLDTANTTPPTIHITHIKVRGKTVSHIGSLPYFRNYLSFQYSGLDFSYPRGVTYRYKLTGLDDQWIETKERTASYPYLPPGTYSFQVKAVNSEGLESSEPAKNNFVILSPLWQTWWFRGGVGTIALTMLGVLFLWRFRRARDKAVLKEKNRQLMVSQRMELVGTLAAGAAHDLKNLMAIILGYSRVVKSQFAADDPRNMPAEYIKDTAQTAVNVIKEILAFTKQQEGQTILVNLPDLLEEIIKIIEVLLPTIKIRWRPPGDEVLLEINPTHFHQVLMNLCLNAGHAMPQGGELELSIHANGPTNEVILEVSDTGTGIPENVLEKVFEPLYTTKEHGKGTGLGLFVVKQIVEQYKGDISVRSLPDKGTTFTITFPALK